jgi:hypothetical protein
MHLRDAAIINARHACRSRPGGRHASRASRLSSGTSGATLLRLLDATMRVLLWV